MEKYSRSKSFLKSKTLRPEAVAEGLWGLSETQQQLYLPQFSFSMQPFGMWGGIQNWALRKAPSGEKDTLRQLMVEIKVHKLCLVRFLFGQRKILC